MGRPKKYDSIMNTILLEIEQTEMKLKELYEKRDSIEKEKEIKSLETLYKVMKSRGITVEQMIEEIKPPKRQYNKKAKQENNADIVVED